MKICPVCSTEYADDVKFCRNDGSGLRALAPAADLVGQVVADRYNVIKKLGAGGMGQVYLAEHVKMRRLSAIKVMHPAMVNDPAAIARFNREASNASRITHPNVCAIYDFGETPDGMIYLAMEFIDGEPLTDLLEREGALAPDRAARIFLQTADALQAAHDLGIVHRDLKPDNIMLARGRDGREIVKVVDFGIAKAAGGEESQKVTKTGLVIGTPEFMSPEQLAGDTLDGRSDLYSLALVFFRMLTGTLPFQADSVQETMVKRLTDEPLKLAQARPDLAFPPGLQAALDAALTKAPVDRYQTVAKFAGDVQQLLGRAAGGPTTALPQTRADADVKTQMLDAPAARPPGPRTTPLTRPSAAAAMPKRRRSLVPVAIGVVVVVGAGAAGMVMFKGGGDTSTTSRVLPPPDTSAGAAPVRPLSNPVTPGRDRSGRPNPTGTTGESRRPTVDPARARDALDDLFLERLSRVTASAVRESAVVFFNAPGIRQADKAYAAFVIGNSYFQEEDRLRGCDWIRAARDLEPTNPTYGQLMSQCRS